jgi:hypothetical protein
LDDCPRESAIPAAPGQCTTLENLQALTLS